MKNTHVILGKRLVYQKPPETGVRSAETASDRPQGQTDDAAKKWETTYDQAKSAIKQLREKHSFTRAARLEQSAIKARDKAKTDKEKAASELGGTLDAILEEAGLPPRQEAQPTAPVPAPAPAPQRRPVTLADAMAEASGRKPSQESQRRVETGPARIEYQMTAGHELDANSPEYKAVERELTTALKEWIRKREARDPRHRDNLGKTLADGYGYVALYDESGVPKLRLFKGDKPVEAVNTGTTEATELTPEDLAKYGVEAKNELKPPPGDLIAWARNFYKNSRGREMQHGETTSTSDGYVIIRDETRKNQSYRVFKKA